MYEYEVADLARKSETDLSALFNEISLALARVEPAGPEWQQLVANPDAAARERRRRLYSFKPR